MPRKSKTASVDHQALQRVLPYLLWPLAIGAWLLLVVALASYHPADAPGYAVVPAPAAPHNWAGRAGAWLAHHLYLMLGPGVWIGAAGALAFIVAGLARKPLSQPWLRVTGIVVMCLTTSCLIAATAPGVGSRPEGSGGLVAIYLAGQMVDRLNVLGSLVILLVSFWVGAILAMDQWVITAARWLGQATVVLAQFVRARPAWSGAGGSAPAGGWGPAVTRAPAPLQPDRSRPTGTALAEDEEPTAEVEAQVDLTPDVGDPDPDGPAHDAPGTYVAEKRQLSVDELRRKIKQLPINFSKPSGSGAAGGAMPLQLDLSGYRFPSLDLLSEPESNFNQEIERLVRDQAVQLEDTLQQYRIEGEVVGIHSGPVITLFEVRLAPGAKVSALNAVASDLARALKAQNVRIVPNTAGKDTVGIEVPNLKKEKVRLKDLMTSNAEVVGRMRLPMFLGKDASGTPLVADLTEMPHMLIAGTTGSGKSVCMNSIIMSFAYTKRPDELRIILVDPKMVELSMFKDIPHLMCPVVTEMSKAAAILEWATDKMDERYELLAEAGVRDVGSYNQMTWEELKDRFQPANAEDEAGIPRKLPYIVIVVDELADMMLTNKEVEGHIVRLAQKARAVGIHLVLATQRPQANVVTGLIKANMPCRISFKVASGLDSRIVLDQKGAELLLGQGDMLYLSPRTTKLSRAQGTLVDDLEIRRVVNFLKTVAQQTFEPQLVQLRAAPAGEGGEEEMEKDPLFEEAVEIVLDSKRGSVSLVQRRLNIGYSRASRLIEQMAQAGILGDYKGSQAREVNMSVEEWQALKAQAAADAAAEAKGTVFEGGDEQDD